MLEMMIDARQADLGHGLAVRRILPFARRRMVGPFIFLDHAGPVAFRDAASARKADVRPHPHIGLATVSYLLSGAITHRDSLAVEQVIRPGDVNWMTAGRGISHSERFEDPSVIGGTGLELLQSWVALPHDAEEADPAFDHHPVRTLPEAGEGGLWLRVIAGSSFGLSSPVKTFSPMFYVHLQLAA
ncbi:MAG: pirin family protein, partial [Burkholderiaceae bacterium]